ncbi:hypothetical protein, partial [Pinirhizobacter sp.]|uniref:hypothetical protein n=1 Tax=Pinirhizobacter sp. TaxID=2950432 RepID=UPI002F3F4C12
MSVRFGRALVPLVAVALLEGCGQSVPVKATYYFPKARTSIVVTETLSCTPKGLLMTNLVVDPTTEYMRDDSAYATIDEKDFGGTFSDADVAITYTGDGRLTGINTSTVGEGPDIVKGVVSVATAIAGLP